MDIKTGELAKQQYFNLYNGLIQRKGSGELLQWMRTFGFFEAPASAGHHLNHAGGLVIHSLNVTDRLFAMGQNSGYEPETLAICGLLHDLCKIDAYKKQADGTYKYDKEDSFPIGHGEKSVILIMRYMQLSNEEIAAIRWHMGAFDDAFRGGSRDLNRAYGESKLAAMLHIADMQATYLDEREDTE